MPTFGEAMMEVMEYEAKQKYLAIGKDEGKKKAELKAEKKKRSMASSRWLKS